MLNTAAFVLASMLCVPAGPIPQREQTAAELAPEKLEGLIEALAKEIEERYVFPDVAREIGTRLREQLFAGARRRITWRAGGRSLGLTRSDDDLRQHS